MRVHCLGVAMKFIPSFRLSQKLPLALIGSALVVGLGVGLGSYFIASSALEQQARQNLDTIAFERANQLSSYIKGIESDLIKTAKSDNTLFAIGNFSKAWRGLDNPSLGTDAATTLQGFFLAGEPDKRIDIDKVTGLTPAYAVNHTHYQPIYREQIAEQGYHDLYLFDLEGHLVYTTRKSDDFATVFSEGSGGKYADTSLGKLYRAAAKDDKVGDLLFADFAPYPAADNMPLAFFAEPVFDATNVKVGVMAISIPADGLAKVISYRQGLGATGETIIVGGDGLARSDSGFTKDMDVLQPTIFDDAIKAAVDGVPGDTAASFRGNDVIAAAAPADVTASLSWAVVAVMNKSEIFAPVANLATLMVGIGGGLLVVVGLLGWLLARSVSRPISRLTASMNALAAGDLDVEVTGDDKTDELGQMARAVQVFRANARRVTEMSEDERAASERRRQERADMMQKLQRSFGEVVDAAVMGDFTRRVQAEFPDAVVGLSDHTINNYACLGAVALGASVLERHFTDRMDRPGPDIVCSMDPKALSELIEGATFIFKERGGDKGPVEAEAPTIAFAFASVVAIRDIAAGEALTERNIWVKRPGGGDFGATDFDGLLGKPAMRAIASGAQIQRADIALS